MYTRVLFVIVFFAGVSSGWLGKTVLGPVQSELTSVVNRSNQLAAISNDDVTASPVQDSTLTNSDLNVARSASQNIADTYYPEENQLFEENSGNTVLAIFNKLLKDRRYNDAMVLYQELVQQNQQIATQLRVVILDKLNVLAETRNNNDFSELIENYLSIYYDDIDVLLLLADFNKTNDSYFEVVDVYLLAKTYAYTDADQQNVLKRFNGFVKDIDAFYTNQKNWLSLISLYSYIDTSGLMTSRFQYQQALAYLRSGDEYFAIEQFKLLSNDGVVGELATIALSKLTDNNTETTASIGSSVSQSSEAIPLQKLGNQYTVDLTINRQDDIKLLIDTGASMTTLSRVKFDSLITSGEATLKDRRVFRTASGVVMGTVYSVSELSIGPYSLENTQIAVLDFDVSRNFDGLLGMNVLGKFRFQIDQENAQLLLNR